MIRKFILIILISVFFSLSCILSACRVEPTPTDQPTITASATLEQATPVPEATSVLEGALPESGEETPTESFVDAVASRTPEPTRTPGPVDEIIEDLVAATGLQSTTFLGLAIEEWLNLAVSLIIILLGYTLGDFLVKSLLRRFVRRTSTDFDDAFLKKIGSELRWLITIFTVKFAIARLTFFSDALSTILNDGVFVIFIILITKMILKLLEFALDYYVIRFEVDVEAHPGRNTLLNLFRRLGQVSIVLVFIVVLLDHFGINVTGLAAAFGLAGLAFSLAAQDTIADAISGMIIMIDQPFRVGDRIEIESLGTWGDVIEIGIRTTRIRTRDNRMVIVPNSQISSNQVVNYSYPDPRYRIEMDIGIGYGQDIENIRQLIYDTVRHVSGILPEKPVDVLYNEMGDSAMIFRVRWWIESYTDTRRVFDRVNTALQQALDEAGIVMPPTLYEVSLKVDPDKGGQFIKTAGNEKDE
jgi:MscS family membrane protein